MRVLPGLSKVIRFHPRTVHPRRQSNAVRYGGVSRSRSSGLKSCIFLLFVPVPVPVEERKCATILLRSIVLFCVNREGQESLPIFTCFRCTVLCIVCSTRYRTSALADVHHLVRESRRARLVRGQQHDLPRPQGLPEELEEQPLLRGGHAACGLGEQNHVAVALVERAAQMQGAPLICTAYQVKKLSYIRVTTCQCLQENKPDVSSASLLSTHPCCDGFRKVAGPLGSAAMMECAPAATCARNERRRSFPAAPGVYPATAPAQTQSNVKCTLQRKSRAQC